MTPQELSDTEEIRRVKHLYSWCYDGADVAGLVDLFTDDAVCDFGPYGTWRGKEAIREGYRYNIEREGPPFSTIHAMANQVITLNGDTAHSRCFLLDILVKGEGNPLTLLGIYDEDYRREDGRWRISRSRIDFLWTAKGGRVPPEGLKQTLSEE